MKTHGCINWAAHSSKLKNDGYQVGFNGSNWRYGWEDGDDMASLASAANCGGVNYRVLNFVQCHFILCLSSSSSKAPVLRVNNNYDNFSIDVLYFVPENLKKVQESC